ncbi:hypothetical protein Bpfe_015085 [Biomphalaria pfeifferi]|uniref:Uncharacterized protein n=1 Tax=Biomphalaria pfeifferi TaxID=112525 RepID=A0AAD8BJ75_BIOPF|nr:hypothetical protein Bpfe_015085 [Biomphalaria pfeifferi]
MASAYMGPERHQPLAVISEGYQDKLRIPEYREDEKFSFGEEYENRLYLLLDTYLELRTTDKMIYVGDLRGSLADTIAEKFCLVHPILSVLPGHFHYAEADDGNRVVPIRLSHLGAEEFFRNLAQDTSTSKEKYDKILIEDCVRYLAEPQTLYRNMTACLATEGKIVIIHRSVELSTLPYFQDAKTRLEQNEPPYTCIIKDLQSSRLDVTWELECLPVRMSKKKWLAMIMDKFPPHMEVLSHIERLRGLRELTEGILKYEADIMEFMDRLLFITATPCQPPTIIPSLHRNGAELMVQPQDTPLKYVMKMQAEDLTALTCEQCARGL